MLRLTRGHAKPMFTFAVYRFIDNILPPAKRVSETWYLGAADAVYQNIQSIKEQRLPFVLILSAVLQSAEEPAPQDHAESMK